MVSQRVLSIHPLSFVPEGDDVVVGRVDTGSYAVLPADGAELLRRLTEGMQPAEASQWYEQTFDEPVDMEDFMSAIEELGFIRDPAEITVHPAALRFQTLGKIVFSAPAWVAYAMLLCWWLMIVISHRDARPAPSQLFFTDSLIAVQLTVLISQIPLLFLHEGFHILAGRRLGLPGKLNASSRLTYIVFETQINGLHSVPRRQRYLPFFAGMVLDTIVVCVLGILAELTRSGSGQLSLTGRMCLAIAFTVVARLAWQFQLFLRTDLYYVLATALNCYDLHTASTSLMKNRWWRLVGRPDRLIDEQQWTGRDRRAGNWYGIFLVIGVLTSLSITCLVTVPILVTYFRDVGRHLLSGSLNGHFWDSLVSATLNAGQIVLVLYLGRRKRRADAGRGPRLLSDQKAG